MDRVFPAIGKDNGIPRTQRLLSLGQRFNAGDRLPDAGEMVLM